MKFFTKLNTTRNYFDLNKTSGMEGEFHCANNFGSKWKFEKPNDLQEFLLGNCGYLKEDISGLWLREKHRPTSETVVPNKESVTTEVITPEETTPHIVETTPVVNEGTLDVDWAWINSLQNTKKDKEELDMYAERDLGIKLNRRNSIDNMVKDLKDKLA